MQRSSGHRQPHDHHSRMRCLRPGHIHGGRQPRVNLTAKLILTGRATPAACSAQQHDFRHAVSSATSAVALQCQTISLVRQDHQQKRRQGPGMQEAHQNGTAPTAVSDANVLKQGTSRDLQTPKAMHTMPVRAHLRFRRRLIESIVPRHEMHCSDAGA